MRKRIDSFKKPPYEFLSNMVPNTLGFSVEYNYQAAKRDDPDYKQFIMESGTPYQAKKRGKHKEPKHWRLVCNDIMLRFLRIKFSDPVFAKKLLYTGDAELIEGNWWGDTWWGVCNGVGKNWLGKLLMQVREEIRNGEVSPNQSNQ